MSDMIQGWSYPSLGCGVVLGWFVFFFNIWQVFNALCFIGSHETGI